MPITLKKLTGKHYLGGGTSKCIKPGDTITVDYIEELGGHAADLSTWEIIGSDDPTLPADAPGVAVEGKPVERVQRKSPAEQEEAGGVSALEVVHRGGGRWIVRNIETGLAIHEGYLKKDEAQALAEATPVEDEESLVESDEDEDADDEELE